MSIDQFIDEAIKEDLQDPTGEVMYGDHATLSTIPKDTINSAYTIAKAPGIIAGVDLGIKIFNKIDPNLEIQVNTVDGEVVNRADLIFKVKGSARSILTGERLVLNFMQRMSGIATLTSQFVQEVHGTGVKILDTRKTTPNLRQFEKWAVKIGGGYNHRFGLYDMIMIKDNHIDFCGGIVKAIDAANLYLQKHDLDIPIEIETRSLNDVKLVLERGDVQRIMLDNFTVQKAQEAIDFIGQRVETEISGGITLDTIRSYAETRPDFISVGALTHSYTSLDISMKASI